MDQVENLKHFFQPESVAVIGASGTPGKIGHTIMANMKQAGFAGQLYPVNPKGGEILGFSVVAAISELPKGLDLAVIAVPRRFVLETVEQLAAIRCKAAIVITAGFKEVGHKGWEYEVKLADLCSEHGMLLLGPNCLGMINSSAGVNASFAYGHPQDGSIAFFSQSGALCVAILDWALGSGIGFSKFISLGNKAVLDEADMLRYLDADPKTKVILGYLENVSHGDKFLKAAYQAGRNKPIIMIKSGTTAAGAKAASSHTGAIAGSDQAYTAAFHKAGVIRVDDVESLFNLARAFAKQTLPKGPGLAIVTNSGGPGILAADTADRCGLKVAALSPETVRGLQEFLPSYAAFYNPVDIIADATAERYRKALNVVVEDESVHSIMVILTPTAGIDVDETARVVARLAKKCGKPVFACFMGKRRVAEAQRILREAGVPCYAFPEPAVQSITAMYEYGLWKLRPEPCYPDYDRHTETAQQLVADALSKGQMEIVEFQAQQILKAYNLPGPKTILARSSELAGDAADEIGYPVVLKIASPQISHKSDVDGVKVGLQSREEVIRQFAQITARAQRMRQDAYIAGCLVQEMAPSGCREVIVGFKRDEQFGPLLMFGLGGIYVEIMKDISFRLVPMSDRDASEIVREIKSYMLLKGVQGEPPANLDALKQVIIAMSHLARDLPNVVEAEFNPVLVNHERVMVADVRLTIKG